MQVTINQNGGGSWVNVSDTSTPTPQQVEEKEKQDLIVLTNEQVKGLYDDIANHIRSTEVNTMYLTINPYNNENVAAELKELRKMVLHLYNYSDFFRNKFPNTQDHNFFMLMIRNVIAAHNTLKGLYKLETDIGTCNVGN